jgi:hypothetical protein
VREKKEETEEKGGGARLLSSRPGFTEVSFVI